MILKQAIVKKMMYGLPHEEQILMVSDFLNWLFADLTPSERQKKLAFWTPKLIEDISTGKFGLWMLIFHYSKFLVSLRWLRYWFHPIKTPREDHLER